MSYRDLLLHDAVHRLLAENLQAQADAAFEADDFEAGMRLEQEAKAQRRMSHKIREDAIRAASRLGSV